MNNCMVTEIQEILPDLLHDKLPPAERARVEAHLAACGECREDLEVLRAVKTAAVFVPSIDANRIAQQIPPYQIILPATERVSRTRPIAWLVAASAAILVAIGGSIIATRDESIPQRTAVASDTSPSSRQPASVDVRAPEVAAGAAGPSSSAHTYALALATDMDGLSDGTLVQLMDDMREFDALPAADPEPMMSVDSVENIGED